VCSWLFELVTEISCDEYLFAISYKMCLLVSVEFSVSINQKPVISLLIESSFSDVVFFSPICTEAGHAGFRLSIP